MAEQHCIICGKEIPERRLAQGKKTCCKHCQMLTPESKQKRSEINKKRYENAENRQKMSESVRAAYQKPEVKQRHKAAINKAYENPEFKQHLSESLKAYHASDRHKNFIEAMNKPETKEKMSKSQLARFSNEEKYKAFVKAMNKPTTKERLRKAMLCKDTQLKIHNTKKKNNSFNTSKPEQSVKTLLEQKFNKIECQYTSDLYPFNCDFYIPQLDLYIECNFTWTHGYRQFDASSQSCLDQLNDWQEKAKLSDYYKQAIYTWTDLDVRKLQTLKDNKLNYKIFYTYEEFEEWLNSIQ